MLWDIIGTDDSKNTDEPGSEAHNMSDDIELARGVLLLAVAGTVFVLAGSELDEYGAAQTIDFAALGTIFITVAIILAIIAVIAVVTKTDV